MIVSFIEHDETTKKYEDFKEKMKYRKPTGGLKGLFDIAAKRMAWPWK